jgi:DNA primase
MSFAEEDVRAVREATDLVALISERVPLRRQGRRFVGRCPFHAERTPSFSVDAERGLYYCFGCQASGDAITFVRATEGLDFVGALRRLADRAGVALREVEDDPAEALARRRRRTLVDAVAKAAAWYHERLLDGADAGPARAYLRSRGFDGTVVRRFQLGWAPERGGLASVLGLPSEVLVTAGLAFVREGRTTDAFRGRVIFPILDHGGQAVALGGRVLPGRDGGGPKYRNSAESPVYSKRRVLYGLSWARSEIVVRGYAVVCEGYTDVIGLHQAGVSVAVATCGTAFGEEHAQLLGRFTERVVLAYDGDEAGLRATERVEAVARAAGLELAVARLPRGRDPAELARDDPAGLRKAVEEAEPYLRFQLRRLVASADRSSPEARSRLEEQALRLIARERSAAVRDGYVVELASLLRGDPAGLRRRLERLRAAARPAARVQGAASGRADPTGSASAAEVRGLEWRGLKLAVQRPETVVDWIGPELFSGALVQDALRSLLEASTLDEAIEEAPAEVADLIRRAAVEELSEPPDEVAAMVVLAAGRRELGALEARISVAESSGAPDGGGADLDGLVRRATRLRLALEPLAGMSDGARPGTDALRELVALLSKEHRGHE